VTARTLAEPVGGEAIGGSQHTLANPGGFIVTRLLSGGLNLLMTTF
jgi:hypothetical protein